MANHFSGPWVWETSALIGVFVSFAVLVILLTIFDGQPIFDWKDITLNTIVSTLSMFLRGLLLYPICECIGQWKWILFERRQRSLMDFERIDQASRGPLGGLTLAWQKDIPWVLRIGAVVTLLVLAVDPFSQQLVQLEHTRRLVAKSGNNWCSTPRTDSYDRGHVFKVREIDSDDSSSERKVIVMGAQPNISMEAAILNGLSRPEGIIDEGFNVFCPTGNCTWDPFDTLGVCSRCNNVTEDLELVQGMGGLFKFMQGSGVSGDDSPEINATAMALPNGHFLLNPDGCYTVSSAFRDSCEVSPAGADAITLPRYSMTSHGTGNPDRTVSMHDIDNMIWSMSVIHLDDMKRSSRRLDEMSSEEEKDARARLGDEISPSDDPEAPLNNWPGSPVAATECALYYCINNIQMSMENNRLQFNMTEVKDAARKPGSWKARNTKDLAPENIPGNLESLEFHERYAAVDMSDIVFHFPSGSETAEFTLTPEAIKSISAYFQSTLRASIWTNDSAALELVRQNIPGAEVLMNGLAESGNVNRPRALWSIWGPMEGDVMRRFERLATSMTNEMRSKGEEMAISIEWYGDGEIVENERRHYGKVWIPTTVYRSGFYWISLHATVLLLGVMFCIMTMRSFKRAQSKNRPVWKNHSLATLRQGAALGMVLEECSDTIKGLEERAEKERFVMFRPDKLPVARKP